MAIMRSGLLSLTSFLFLLIRIPVIITSSPGFTLSTKVPSRRTHIVLGIVPDFIVLKGSYILTSW